MGNCKLLTSSLDKLTSNMCDIRGIQYDKCKVDMDLVNIFSKDIAQRCKTEMQNKKRRVRYKGDEKNFVHSRGYWDCDEKFYLMI